MTRLSVVKRAILTDHGPVMTALWTFVAIIIPTLFRWILDRGQSGVPFVTFFPAILLAAVFLGWKSGAVTSVMSGAIANRLFRQDAGLADFDSTDAVMLALYLLTCALLLLIAETLRRTVRELERSLVSEAILKSELAHRVKNTLSIVQSLANLTARTADKATFVDTLSGRIAALGRATDVLTTARSDSCLVPDLVEEGVRPFHSGSNFQIGGPACHVSRDCSVQFVLILHELCTNASKHGALSKPDGLITIRWQQTGQQIILIWTETGGPAVSCPTKLGMGSKLIASRPELIEVTTDFHPAGVECRMVIKAGQGEG